MGHSHIPESRPSYGNSGRAEETRKETHRKKSVDVWGVDCRELKSDENKKGAHICPTC